MKVGRYTQLAAFDSATAMVSALARSLTGKGFPFVGTLPSWTEPLLTPFASIVNRIPVKIRENLFVAAGQTESVQPDKLAHASVEDACHWVVQQYPDRKYPVVAIGSSNGAALHLFAALGIPWLPQTFLIPVARSGTTPDDGQRELAWSERVAPAFLKNNPDVSLHHMQDPIQDRLMVRAISYFRVKKLRLGIHYELFLKKALSPGGVILLIECQKSWPVVQVSDRHFFQFGALGGVPAEEYYTGSSRIKNFLLEQHSEPSDWMPPKPNFTAPEAEWGFEPTLRADVHRFSTTHHQTCKRIVFKEPEDVSDLTADFYRAWSKKAEQTPARLLVESFILLDPQWVLRTRTIPYWTVFSTKPSLNRTLDYLTKLDQSSAFDEILAFLFAHGVESVGSASVADWKSLSRYARLSFRLVGVDEKAYPRDFGVFLRYHRALWRSSPLSVQTVSPVSPTIVFDFIAEHGDRCGVSLEEGPPN